VNTYNEVIGYSELELVSPYEVKTLHDLCLIQTVNDHARLSIVGFIPEEKKASCLQKASTTDRIELYQKKGGERVQPLFIGYVTEVAVQMVRGVYQITIEAISATFQLDCQRRKRSFQHAKMRYSDMIQQVLADYPGADVIDTVSKTTPLQQFILQYEETDWQFLQRMASHFRTVLIPAIDGEQPKFWFGLPEGRVATISSTNYTLSKNRAQFLQIAHNDLERPVVESSMLMYNVESYQPLRLGARVSFQKKELVVAQSIARMKQGVLTFDYQLLPESGVRQERRTIPLLAGVSIEGTVLAIQKDQVQLHLSIDSEQKKEEATWFSLATPYSAEGHSGFYSPPEEGDQVHLLFPTSQETAAFVRQSVRKSGDTNPKTADSKTAYWGTAKGKHLKFDPQSVELTATEGAVFLQLHQESGITIHSKHPLTVTASEDVTLTGKTMTMSGTESLRFTCGSSSLVLDGITDIQGQTVMMTASVKGPVSVTAAPEDEDDEDDLDSALDLLGMIPLTGGNV